MIQILSNLHESYENITENLEDKLVDDFNTLSNERISDKLLDNYN